MPGLSRPTPSPYVLDLTRRLAEDYHGLPLPDVTRAVNEVVHDVTGGQGWGDWSGTPDGIPAIIEVIDLLAREELEALQERLAVPRR